MGDLIATIGGRVVDAGLASMAISGLAMLAMLATRQPSRRRAIARAGVLGVLLTLPLVTLRPVGTIDLVGPIREAAGPASEWLGALIGLDGMRGPRWSMVPLGLVQRLGRGLLLAYGLGAAAGLVRLLIGGLGSAWIVGRSTEPDGPVVASYRSLPFNPGRRRPRLRVSTRVRRPVLLGIVRPTILIPPALVEREARDDFRLAMLHELAHAEASDPGFAMASELAGALWFVVPPLWWVRRHLRLDGEFLADREAALTYGASRHYAAGLVGVAASPGSTSTAASATVGPGRGGSALFQRVLMLVRCPFPVEGRPPLWWSGVLVATAPLLVAVLTGLTVGTWAITVPTGTGATPGLVSIARLILDDSPATAPILLPVRVAGRFTMDFEVYVRSAELTEVQVMGHPLAVSTTSRDSFLDDAPRWHRVRIVRGDTRLTLVLDGGRPVLVEPPPPDDGISLRAVPGRSTTFRSIRIWDHS